MILVAWRRRRVLLIVLLLAGACTPDEGSGTYDADISGARDAHLAGKATADESSWLSSTDHSFSIVMYLPDSLPSLKEAQGGALQLVSVPSVSAGDYKAVSMTRSLSETSGEMGVVLTGDEIIQWDIIDGRVHIDVGGRPARRRRGSFSVRFASRSNRADTITFSGNFDIK